VSLRRFLGCSRTLLAKRTCVISEEESKVLGEKSTIAAPASEPFEEAFSMGWRVAYLYHVASIAPADSPPGSALAVERHLSKGLRARLLAGQIKGGIDRVSVESGWPAASPPDTSCVDDQVAKLPTEGELSNDDVEALQGAVVQLNAQLIDTLTILDFRQGKAYGVGTQLAETVLVPSASGLDDGQVDARLAEMFSKDRIRQLRGQLRALKTLFPKYAGDAVSATLSDWGKWIRPRAGKKIKFTELSELLNEQGQIWRALLSGEEEPTDALQVPDYVYAAIHLASQIRRLGMAAVGNLLGIVIVGLSLVVAGLLAYGAAGHSVQNALNVGIVALLGALGISAASVTAGLRRALAAVGDSLWDSELAASVATAIYRGPWPVDNSSIDKLRQRRLQETRKPKRQLNSSFFDRIKPVRPQSDT
jgi:hypothetical protein